MRVRHDARGRGRRRDMIFWLMGGLDLLIAQAIAHSKLDFIIRLREHI